MKKILAFALVLVLVLSLCACGSNPYEKYEHINKMLDEGNYEGAIYAIMEMYYANQPTPDPNATTTTAPPEPTDEEREAMQDYINYTRDLNSYLENGSISYWKDDVSYSGIAALECIYNELQNLSAIDKWVGTEWTTTDNHFSDALEVNWNRQEVLDAFQTVKDVALSKSYTTTDNMGNVSEGGTARWYYDANGVLTRLKGERYTKPFFHRDYYDDLYYTYDDKGNVTQIKGGYSDKVEALITYTYENGKIVNEHIKTNSREWDVAYSYDDAGRLARLDWVDADEAPEQILYTYDDKGNLLSEELTRRYNYSGSLGVKTQYVYRMEYTYDASGKLVSGTYITEGWGWTHDGNGVREYIGSETKDQYTYTCDDQGRVTGYTVIPGNKVDTYGDGEGEILDTPDYTQRIYTVTYGDYYIYAPAK